MQEKQGKKEKEPQKKIKYPLNKKAMTTTNTSCHNMNLLSIKLLTKQHHCAKSSTCM
jgi:hypothetical protein